MPSSATTWAPRSSSRACRPVGVRSCSMAGTGVGAAAGSVAVGSRRKRAMSSSVQDRTCSTITTKPSALDSGSSVSGVRPKAWIEAAATRKVVMTTTTSCSASPRMAGPVTVGSERRRSTASTRPTITGTPTGRKAAARRTPESSMATNLTERDRSAEQ